MKLYSSSAWYLSRYGIHPDSTSPVYVTPSLSFPLCDEETERARNHAIHLMAENHALRTKIAGLEQDKQELIESNEKLSQKIGKLSREQPKGYIHQAHFNDSSSNGQLATTPNRSSMSAKLGDQSLTLQVLQALPRTRPRSVSASAISTFSTSISSTLKNSKRYTSAALAEKYDGIFSRLQDFVASWTPAYRIP